MKRQERDTFGAIVTKANNPRSQEIFIVTADSERRARDLIDACASKLGWQSDGHVFLVMKCPHEPSMPVANQAKPVPPQD